MAAVPYAFGYSNTTAVERQPIYVSDVWRQIPLVPLVASNGGVVSAATAVAVATDNPLRFACAFPAPMIPGNWGDGVSYQPTLIDSNRVTLKYDPSIWVGDCDLNCVNFSMPPALLGLAPPFTISYWSYTGTTGSNITTTPSGVQLIASNVASPQTLVSLSNGPGVTLSTTNLLDGQLVNVGLASSISVSGGFAAGSAYVPAMASTVSPNVLSVDARGAHSLSFTGSLEDLNSLIGTGPLPRNAIITTAGSTTITLPTPSAAYAGTKISLRPSMVCYLEPRAYIMGIGAPYGSVGGGPVPLSADSYASFLCNGSYWITI